VTERTSEARMSDPADDILITCALRFHGYAYLDDHPFDHQRALQQYIEDGILPAAIEQQMAMFFLLQRFLYKWGGEMLPRTDLYWERFRALFDLVSQHDVPERYRESHHAETWSQEYAPRLEECRAVVRAMTEQTKENP
jgi:hypothetical protein